MNILHIIPNLCKGGAERLCIDISNQLNDLGHNVKIVVLDHINQYDKFTQNLSIVHLNLRIELKVSKKNYLNIEELNELVKNFKPDIIHSHLFLAELYAQHLNIDIPHFCHVHDNMHQLQKQKWRKSLSKKGLIKQFERHYYLQLNQRKKVYFLCISKDAQRFIENNLPLESNVPVFFPNAINRKTFKPNKTQPTPPFTFCNIGSFVEKKGQRLLIETAFELKRNNIDFHLHLLGDGELKSKLETYSKSLHLENHITFHGIHDHPEEVLQDADLYLHAASYEPFGLVLIEAMSTGLPVISTDGRGNRDFMDGSNGILLDHRDPKKFAQEIIDLINHTEKYKKLQEGALKTAENYDIVSYVDRLLELYQKAIDEQKR